MTNSILKAQSRDSLRPEADDSAAPTEKPGWETPKMEEVSEQVMAQPYIRFT